MKPELKRHLISAGITFGAAFLLFVGTELQSLDAETITQGAIAGVLIAGVRAGIKAAVEMFIVK